MISLTNLGCLIPEVKKSITAGSYLLIFDLKVVLDKLKVNFGLETTPVNVLPFAPLKIEEVGFL